MPNLLSCNLASYRGHVEKAYEHLPTIGVKHVEIALPPMDKADEVMANLAAHGLSPATLMASGDIASDAIVEQFAGFCDVARKMGVTVIFTSVHAGEIPKPTVYERMRRVGEEAAKRSVLVAMETHPDLMQNGDVAMETLRAIDHPNIRMNFDTANIMYYNEHTTTRDELSKVARHVASVHLKDSNGRPRAWDFPTLGDGVIDFRRCIRMLNEVGFHGPFTMELEGIEGQKLNAEEAAEDVAKSVAYLRRIAEFE
jgi:sugar phosphate isomerase/epimerase